MASAIKMDELLFSWLTSDDVYERVLQWIESCRAQETNQGRAAEKDHENDSTGTENSPNSVVIPPFYPRGNWNCNDSEPRRRRRFTAIKQHEKWDPLLPDEEKKDSPEMEDELTKGAFNPPRTIENACARDHARVIFNELGQDPPLTSPGSVSSVTSEEDKLSQKLDRKYLTQDSFVRITKEVCRFPSFFNQPLYQRILDLWNEAYADHQSPMEVVTFSMLEWYWKREMESYDVSDRFFRLVKKPENDFILRDDFLPFIKALLNDHPGLEFLSSHAEFQEKYAVTVITRIFYSVDKCHSGRITSRQIRRSDLLEAFQQVDEEEDINNVTRFLSYEHFYVLYCRFWELDHDRDYRITREDLLKYGDHSLSHMIVDRIFDAAPRPFNPPNPNRDYLSYEDFIYFMLSEEDKSNEVSVHYWFSCVDVDGDGKLNNMEMRSFYAVQLHRMQCMGHEIVPFEDMLCQMMDMIKPSSTEHLVADDFLQPECSQVSGALFDALFNLNKYLMFEQRDPFMERQKREDEFDCDWDRFACMDYKRLAMEEEAREEEAMEIDWVTVDDEEYDDNRPRGVAGNNFEGAASSEAPF